MADRRKSSYTWANLNRQLPHHVAVWWSNYQTGEKAHDFQLRGEILTSAIRLEKDSKTFSASIEWDEYLVFCFSNREAAKQFRERWRGQFIAINARTFIRLAAVNAHRKSRLHCLAVAGECDDGDAAAVKAIIDRSSMTHQQQIVQLHHSVDMLGIGP